MENKKCEEVYTRRLILDDDKEKFALMKFRKQVADCLTESHQDDRFLLRWLRARKFDVDNAEKMLRRSLEWRKKWKLDSLKDMEIPEVFQRYYPHGLSGFDKEGSPIIIIPFAGFDSNGLLHAVSKRELISVTLKQFEDYLELARQQATKHGPAALKIVCIIDMMDFNLKQFTYRPAAEVVISLIQMYEANYPEVLKTCYIINTPRVFMFAYNMIKKFLDDYTLEKIQLHRPSETDKARAEILKAINADQLPAHFGGTMTDPDGNPKCITKINYGGKVPKTYYVKKREVMRCEEVYNTSIIKRGDELVLPFTCDEDKSFLKWSFYTDRNDIKFGISKILTAEGTKGADYFKLTNDSIDWEIPLHKVSSHETEEIGFIECSANHTYYVIFDNTYSLVRSKKLSYRVALTPPVRSTTLLSVDEE